MLNKYFKFLRNFNSLPDDPFICNFFTCATRPYHELLQRLSHTTGWEPLDKLYTSLTSHSNKKNNSWNYISFNTIKPQWLQVMLTFSIASLHIRSTLSKNPENLPLLFNHKPHWSAPIGHLVNFAVLRQHNQIPSRWKTSIQSVNLISLWGSLMKAVLGWRKKALGKHLVARVLGCNQEVYLRIDEFFYNRNSTDC